MPFGVVSRLDSESLRPAVTRVLTSAEFAHSDRMRQLLEFLVEAALAGRSHEIKETVIGVQVFGRDPGYDPKTDGIVRTEARRLRLKLLEYYLGSGRQEPIRIELPKGSYVPVFLDQGTANPELPPAAPVARRVWPAAALCLALAAVAAGLLFRNREPASPPLPRKFTSGSGNARSPVFSPDGTRLAYSVDDMGTSHIFTAPVSSGGPVAWTDGQVADYEPAWSPDGRQLAFLRQLPGRRYEVRIARAPHDSVRLAEIAGRDAVDWSSDGQWIAVADQVAQDAPKSIFLVDARSGAKRQLTAPPRETLGDGAPRFSPDGERVGFLRMVTDGADDLYVMAVTAPAGAAPRRILSARSRIGAWSWMPSGNEVLVSAVKGETPRSLWRVRVSDGSMRRIAETGADPMTPAVSPRGGRLAWARVVQDTNIWRLALDGSERDRGIVTSASADTSPQVSPDGRFLAFRTSRTGFFEIWVSDIDGSHPRQLTWMKGPVTGSPRWSPDGKFLVFDSREKGNADIYRVPAAGGATVQLTFDASNETVPSWSRDGRYIYFASDRDGRQQVFRMPAAGGPAKALTREGGSAAFESADGASLYYARGPQQPGLWRIPLRPEGASEEPVIPDLDKAMWGSWALASGGIYYVRRPGLPGSKWQIVFQTAAGARRVIRDLDRQPVTWDNALALAPDEKTLYFTTLDSAGSDIYILDGVR